MFRNSRPKNSLTEIKPTIFMLYNKKNLITKIPQA